MRIMDHAVWDDVQNFTHGCVRCKSRAHAAAYPQDHPKLGAAGEVVSVKAGYARHSLYPSRIADYAVPGVLRKMRVSGGTKDWGERRHHWSGRRLLRSAELRARNRRRGATCFVCGSCRPAGLCSFLCVAPRSSSVH
jgi:hypothetical protein